MIFIRAATAVDQKAITQLVRSARINPFGLHWPRFIVAEAAGQLVGVGQIKILGDGTPELASIAVTPACQGLGIGGAIVETLIARAAGPLYLRCASHNESYYPRFGFRTLTPKEMPGNLARTYRIANRVMQVINWFTGSQGQLLIMGIHIEGK